MKKLSALLAFVLALVLALGASGALAQGSVLGENIDVSGKLVILHTNDVHGRAVQMDESLGYAAVAGVRKQLEAEGAQVLLLDAGDASQGTPIVNMSQGMAAMDFMNAVGYDAMVLGNHEFDWGPDNAMQLIERADFPIMGANIIDRATGDCPLVQRVTFELADRRIGVFGVGTPEIKTKSNPEKNRAIDVLMEDDLYACAQAQIDALKGEGCDMIIMLCHLGVDESSVPNRSIDVIEHTSGIDLCVDGHSHTVMDGGERVGDTLLTSTGRYLANIGYVIVEADGSMTAGLYHSDAPVSDDETTAIVGKVNDEVNAELGKSFARTEVLMNGQREIVRSQETNLGDFSADAFLWQAREAVGGNVDIAIVNGGGIRDSIAEGDITMLNMKTVFPFDNTIVVVDLLGSELLEAIEASCCAAPDALGGFPQVAGIEFTVDTTVPFEAGELYPDSTYYQPAAPGSRVTITGIGGEPFDPEKIYRIATTDFLAVGGDTYYVFRYAGKTAMVDTGISPEDAMASYAQMLGGVVTAAQYGEPAGRITIIK